MDVKINNEKTECFASRIMPEDIRYSRWDSSQFIASKNIKEIANYFFLGNAINFCFWIDRYDKRYQYGMYEGSAAMWRMLCDNRALQDIAYISSMELEEEKELMRMPLPYDRWRAFREAGRVLSKTYDGDILCLCEECFWDAEKITYAIALAFPMWKDEYRGVAFNKRAQLFIAMLHGRWGRESKIKNMEALSCLADYQLPKVLEYYGVLCYNDSIKQAIDRQFIFSHQSNEEFEIRTQTINAVNQICVCLKRKGYEVVPIQLDYLIWKQAHAIPRPHHLTITTAY